MDVKLPIKDKIEFLPKGLSEEENYPRNLFMIPNQLLSGVVLYMQLQLL